MEKFGIFELLDTLSALAGTSQPPAEPPAKPSESEREDKNSRQPDPDGHERNARFSPSGETEGKTGANEADAQQALSEERNARAISDFLSRHDKLSQKIEKKK